MRPLPRHFVRNLVLLCVGAGLMSCDECEDCDDSTASEPGYTLEVSPPAMELAAGGSKSGSVTVIRSGGFKEVVTLRVTAPAGLAATPSSTSIVYPRNEVDLAVAALDGTAPGRYTIRVVASARGFADQTDSLVVTVEEAAPGGFTLWLSPTTRTLLPGQRDTVIVNIARIPPFALIVGLAVTGAPPGVNAVCYPREILPGDVNSRLVLDVALEADPGTWPLTVTGTSSLVANQSAVLTLTVPPLPQGFVLTVSPDTLVVPQVRRGTAAVTIARTGTFSGAVALSAADAPLGVTPTFDPASIASPATTASLHVDVAGYVAIGNYPLTVRGSSAGVASRADTLVLRVIPTPGGFTLAVSPDTLFVAPGASDTATVTITRTGTFAGAVALDITGAPSGVSASFAPATVPESGTASALSISVASWVAPGTYPLSVRGAAAGVHSATTPLVLKVPVAGGGITITTPSMVIVRQGGTGGTPIGIGRIAPFSGPVTLTAEGLPAGVTAVFTPATVEPGQTVAAVTYTALATVPLGTYQVTVRASGFGVASATAPQMLLVTAQ